MIFAAKTAANTDTNTIIQTLNFFDIAFTMPDAAGTFSFPILSVLKKGDPFYIV